VFDGAYYFLSKVVATPAAGRCNGRLFTIGSKVVVGERIALPLAADGINGDAVLGASDYDRPLESGHVELITENMEWFVI
jgi:hypothetical protein